MQIVIWQNGRLADTINLHDIDSEIWKTNVGYWLGAECQDRGFMTKACRVLLDYAFQELNLNRVEILCTVQNTKGRAIPERLGFVQEDVIRQAEWLYDHYNDHVSTPCWPRTDSSRSTVYCLPHARPDRRP